MDDININTPMQSEAPRIEPTTSPPDNRRKRSKVVKSVLIIFVLFGLIGTGLYFWHNQKPEPPPVVTDNFVKTGYDDACALVGKADVEAAFDMKFEEFTPDEQGYRAGLTEESSSCTINQVHEHTAKGALEFTSLQIAVDNFVNAEEAKRNMNTMRKSVVIDGKVLDVTTEVSNLGDEAFFSKNQVFGATQEYLFVRKGTRLFHFIAVKFNGIDSEKVRPQLVEVAKKAVE